ncbi:MAG: 2-oxoacid:ferredoxin oxidoreductase subunit beta, partial [Ignavibacteria bacterium]|nr:2-oxoacid:ferredoxin oxidoreductase subunit beta [Ignavibacteria bacterium]
MDTILNNGTNTAAEKTIPPPAKLNAKDYSSDQDVRWCPGCGDYSILAQVQRVMPSFNLPKEKTVFVAGIGCSSRFPYYMNTYGFHGIHGRAAAIASGLKMTRPELDVWIVSGDGDLLSIGGNHFIHALRRNLNLILMLFNNKIYGLTKGQYSPTSEHGKVTKSSPVGTLEEPFNPLTLALASGGSFVSRTMDRDAKHMQNILSRAHEHNGTSFIEIYQNCNIYNDGAFFTYTEKESKAEHALFVENGKPLIYGEKKDKGIKLNGFRPEIININEGTNSINDVIVYDDTSKELAMIVAQLSDFEGFPVPFGVLYKVNKPVYETQMEEQIENSISKLGKGSLENLLFSGNTWEIK